MSINQAEHLKFLKFHSNPEELQPEDLESLIEWENKYPYCQSLKILAVKASEKTSQQSSFLAQAAASLSDRGVLYRFIHDIAHFKTDISQLSEESTTVAPANYEPVDTMTAFGINLNEIVGAEFREPSPQLTQETEEELPSEETIPVVEAEINVGEELEPEFTEDSEEEITSEETQEEILEEVPVEVEEEFTDEKALPEVEEVTSEEINVEEEISPELIEDVEEEIISEEIQEEVLEEGPVEVEEEPTQEEDLPEVEEHEHTIVAEEKTPEFINEADEAESETAVSQDLQDEIAEPFAEQEEEIISVNEEESEPLAEELVIESPAQTDFLAYAEKESNNNTAEEEIPSEEEVTDAKEDVTPYHDNRMPYTFLWWLNKTRKEYEHSHQPFAKASTSSFKLDTQKEIKKKDTNDLNHQIAENIFHLRGVEELTENIPQNTTVPYNFRRKEFEIIDKFIKEEPQIKPPAPNKIDTENKAKKSSEDHGEVVSETLAKIYVEQMLYHKALDVYKKLSLKFPEKSTYFASQIKYLELKVN